MDIFALIAEEAPGAFSVYDLDGTYRWVSEGFVAALGYQPEDLVGRSAYEFIHPEDHAAGQQGHQQLFQRHEPVVVRCRLRAADGTYRWVETASRLVRRERVIVSTSSWVDSKQSAVERLRAERELASRFRAIDEQHRQFLTAISHRARHPVTVIGGMTEVLRTHGETIDPERRTQLLSRISSNVAQLADLIEDVTQAESLARRADRVRVRPIHLYQLVRETLAEVADHDAPITVIVPSDLVVFGDENMLRLALTALLDNAIEHTPIDTAIWIQTSATHDGTVISVKDAGPGIDPAVREEIFAPFHRGDPNSPDPGLGLGLHTVAEVAAVHGGRAWVTDRNGGGAAFHLLLPTAAAHTIRRQQSLPVVAARRASLPSEDSGNAQRTVAAQPIRVLVVDDDQVVTELVAMTLEAEGFVVDVANNGIQAMEQIADSPPDLLICDVLMPEMDGRDLVRTIRGTLGMAELPIILCSALYDEDEGKSWRGAADACIAKPFSPEYLIKEVCRVLTGLSARTGMGAQLSQQ